MHAANFIEGYYVLVSRRLNTAGNKLLVKWPGPKRVIKCEDEWTFRVEDLLNHSTEQVHSTRLKFFSNKDLEITEERKNHIAFHEARYSIKEFLQPKFHPKDTKWKFLVAWQGLEDNQNSWETVQALVEDVAGLVKKYVAEHEGNKLVQKMMTKFPTILNQ